MTPAFHETDPASNRSMPQSTVIPVLAYPDVREAIGWLCQVFGFSERLRIGQHRAQLSFGAGTIVVSALPKGEVGVTERPVGGTDSVMVRVPDVDAHYDTSCQFGARIINPPTDYPYGERQYVVADLGGHVWTFSQTIADVDPASWDGVLLSDR
jgi:uncharacterized glyoxalase superfamily protein PhnB